MTNSNSAAFAKAAFYHPDGGADSPQEGLTKREYFAAMAMQGIISTTNMGFNHLKDGRIAKEAVILADALINALNQNNDTQTN